MEVWLLNAADMKAVPGRKSDVPGCGVDRLALRAWPTGTVVRAAAGDPPLRILTATGIDWSVPAPGTQYDRS